MVGPQREPNVLVTGTPGMGKTSTFSRCGSATKLMKHINIGDLVKEKELHDGWDDELKCVVVNEDLVCYELEDQMRVGINIVDYHGCDFYPERWSDVVVGLQTDTAVFYERLSNRGCMDAKLQNNIECEVFQVLLAEARESYMEGVVMHLISNTIEDMSSNVG